MCRPIPGPAEEQLCPSALETALRRAVYVRHRRSRHISHRTCGEPLSSPLR